MHLQTKPREYVLPIRLSPFCNEGPQGFILRLGESNLLTTQELQSMSIFYNYDLMISKNILGIEAIDPDLHNQLRFISALWAIDQRVWNTKYARFCPHCLIDHNYWKVEWELNFYDVCHHHKVWLVDQCGSCGEKLSWQRERLGQCRCGSNLRTESTKSCPESAVEIARTLSLKIMQQDSQSTPLIFKETNIEQTQRLIRYLGNYMSLASGKNPLKMRLAGDLNRSWPVTSLAAEVVADWPNALHQSLTQLEEQNRVDGRPSLNVVFGQAYHYVFKALKESAFKEIRYQFELWINKAWRGGVARRNKRLTSDLMKNAAWIPSAVACDFLGISYQRLEMLIREGTIEGETHISEKGRKFVMVRQDNLDQVKQHLFGFIDMTTAGKLLGLNKRRMRKILTLVFVDAKKTGAAVTSPWQVSRIELNKLLELSNTLEIVSIPDEDCVSMAHLLRYWTWTNEEVAALIFSVKSADIAPVNRLDGFAGIAAWNFNLIVLNNWKLKNQKGMGTWLTITQAAKVLGIKEQVAYEMVKLGYLESEVMPHQVKRGTRIRRATIEAFNEKYIFSTKLAELMGSSSRKVISHLASFEVHPISGPNVDGARQVLYRREKLFDELLINKGGSFKRY